MAIAIKEVVGISTFHSQNKGKTGFNIFLIEPFPDGTEGAFGMRTSNEFTYEDYGLKVGDHVKIYKDVIESSKGTFPVIQEIEKVNVPFKKNEGQK